MYAKLMSIASGLRKSILPETHKDINEIYKRRLNKYLSLIATHGENNAQIVNNMFTEEKRDQ